MAHFISGIIAKEACADRIADEIPFKDYYKLNQGYVVFPISEELSDQKVDVPQTFDFKEFSYLSVEVAELLKKASILSPLAYVETEYFGSEGVQSAMVLVDGQTAYGPKQDEIGPINEALKVIGVKLVNGCSDEFEAIGFANVRCNEDFLKDG